MLAGIHNSLRSQTQQRIDEGFLGFSTHDQQLHALAQDVIGVGKRDKDTIANSITRSTIDGDFKRISSKIQIRSTDPLIAVVKKNSSVLGHLIRWMYGQAEIVDGQPDVRLFRNLPILIIDDEADNATINTSKENVTAINGRIRALMSLFEKRAYVGYTATPFANIFIPYQADDVPVGHNIRLDDVFIDVQEDLFPKDFIVNIPAPSNYIGPERIFGIGEGSDLGESDDESKKQTILPLVRQILDFNDSIPNLHKRTDAQPNFLPPSLFEAVRSYLLATAIRRARGHIGFHSSMLVHVTRFTNWQSNVGVLMDEIIKGIRENIVANSTNEFSLFERLFISDFVPTTQRFTDNLLHFEDIEISSVLWSDVKEQLHYVASKTEVRVVHGGGDQTGLGITKNLDYHLYSKGLFVIAVGGDKLSRGLTLEGLCVSYFLRASKMYDTLMQMGRWFGYRPGYADVCRLYTSEELVTWYRHIALASDELRQQFDQMITAGRSPKDFGLKVRSLPGVLQITAVAKLRYSGKIELSYSDSLIETHTFSKTQSDYSSNFNITQKFIDDLGNPTRSESDFVWRNVNPISIIGFLEGYRAHKTQRSLQPLLICDYIQKQSVNGVLNSWTVVVVNKQSIGGTEFFVDSMRLIKITPLIRRADGVTEKPWSFDPYSSASYKIKKGHIISREHESIDLTPEARTKAQLLSLDLMQKKWDREKQKRDREGTTMKKERPEHIPAIPTGSVVRAIRSKTNGLLLIYPLDPYEVKLDEDTMALSNDHPLIGYAISFPVIENDVKVSYIANQQFLKEQEYPEEFDNQPEETE